MTGKGRGQDRTGHARQADERTHTRQTGVSAARRGARTCIPLRETCVRGRQTGLVATALRPFLASVPQVARGNLRDEAGWWMPAAEGGG
jgi:hypothetical protein